MFHVQDVDGPDQTHIRNYKIQFGKYDIQARNYKIQTEIMSIHMDAHRMSGMSVASCACLLV